MKKYQFRLARLLELRRMQAEMVQARLEQQMAVVRRHEDMKREIARQRDEANRGGMRDGAGGIELAGAANFRAYAQRANSMVDGELQRARQGAAQIRQALIEAERAVKALETLDERGKARWHKELAREIEEFAAEVFLARWKPAEESGGAESLTHPAGD